jgi:hypothetical protein
VLEDDPTLGLAVLIIGGLPRPMIRFESFSSFSLRLEQQIRNGRVIMQKDMSMDYHVAELSTWVEFWAQRLDMSTQNKD